MIAASQLTRRFGDRVAVENLTFDVRGGEIFALLGPNGAGKTTTLRMLGGLIAPSSGTATIDGFRVDRDGARVRSRVGFLTEAPGHWERLTARMNLMVYARLHGLKHPDRVVERSLDSFELGDGGDRLVAELSKGMKQRLALARALLHEPRVVLLDEPTSGLDPQTARSVRALITRLRDEGRAIVLSSHNLDEVERLADRVAVIERRLVAMDTPAALRQQLFGRRVRIDLVQPAASFEGVARAAGAAGLRLHDSSLSIDVDDAPITPRIVRALVEAGADVLAVVPEDVRLEDVYLRLIQ